MILSNNYVKKNNIFLKNKILDMFYFDDVLMEPKIMSMVYSEFIFLDSLPSNSIVGYGKMDRINKYIYRTQLTHTATKFLKRLRNNLKSTPSNYL